MDSIKDSKRRDRVQKACTICRKRKIKCSGGNPCSNCGTSGNDCVYPLDSERKPRKRVNKPKTDTVQALDDRLGRLETMLMTLASKMGGSMIQIPDEVGHDDDDNSLMSSEANGHVDDDDDDDDNIDDENYEKATSGTKDFSITHPIVGKDQSADHKVFHLSERYYGSHSNMNIFSDKSVKWMYKQLPLEHSNLLTPIGNLPIIFAICMKTFNDIWFLPRPADVELKKKLSEGWFPDDADLIFDLIPCFDNIYLAGNIINSDLLKRLFHSYYHEEKRNFTESELLIMNISLSLCILSVIDKRMGASSHGNSPHDSTNGGVNTTGRTPTLFAYSTNDLIQLQTRFFSSSIYYYDMISVSSDGIKTIQAILLLIVFLETSWIKLYVNYILASIAVRYAQEIGLHRMESLINLPEEEANLRRRIWYLCEYLDMEICYRNGKPPLINPLDVSTLTGKDIYLSIKDKGLETYGNYRIFPSVSTGEVDSLDPELLKFIFNHNPFESYMSYLMNQLNKIRAKSYSLLFSASSCNHSLENLISTLTALNSDMTKLVLSMAPNLRPKFYNDAEFHDSMVFHSFNDTKDLELLLCFYLTYFIHLMTINRLITQVDIDKVNNDNSEVVKFRNLSLNSSRTILHIVKKIDRNIVPYSCINWLIHYPFSAFLTLLASCLNRPKSVETVHDVNLLIDVTLNFFAFNKNVLHNNGKVNHNYSKSYSKVYNQRESTIFLMCGLIFHIGLRIIESKSTYKFIDNNPPLVKHLDDCKLIFPELYREKKHDHEIITGSFPYFNYNGYEDSPLTLPNSLLPGPTGYMTIPFINPNNNSLTDLNSPNNVSNFKTSSNLNSKSNSTTNTSAPYDDRNSLASLLYYKSPGANALSPFFNEILANNNSNNEIRNNNDSEGKDKVKGITESEFKDGLDKFFGMEVATPNFFFDNNLGL